MNNADQSTRDARLDLSAEETPTHLVIEGLVADPQRLAPADLSTLPRTSCTGVLQCDHRPDVGNQEWQGISLTTLLELAHPQPDAAYVRVHARNYCVPLSLDEIDTAVLVERIDGQPLSKDRGAPWRLFVPSSQCHINVKWVDRLEVTATRGANLEDRAARARQRGRITNNEP